MRSHAVFASLTLFFFAAVPANHASAQWPNGPDDDPQDAYPNDPGFVKINGDGEVTGGQWNLWSFVPPEWAENKNFRQAEVAMGTGIHADRAWQRTIGDRRTTIAVLDSGIRWDNTDLQMKFYLNKGELENCKPQQTDPPADDDFDIDGNGYFNIADYLAADPAWGTERDGMGNGNGLLDPQDLIMTCSDGVDSDGNGFRDDISGWDTMWNDNDAFDDTDFGHGTGEGRDSAAAGNDGKGDIGVCPECSVLMVRVGDSFVVDANDFATGVIFGVDSGASVIQEALGTVNNTAYTIEALEYAYLNNVVVMASAADELSFHHNMPGTNNHTVYVHAIVFDGPSPAKSTTFLNFNNCTNFGGQLVLSTPGTGCSSEAVGISSGHAGLIYSAALEVDLDPPLSAEEVRGILIQSADDINVPEAKDDVTKFPSGEGWDLHFGYGRNNVRTSVDMVLDDWIPPEVDIASPKWFEPIEVTQRPTIEITGRVGSRVDGLPARYDNYSWELEYALGVAPADGWETIASDTGVAGDETPAVLATWDVAKASEKIDYTVPLTDPHQYSITLRLKVTTTHGDKTLYNEYRKTAHLLKDPTLLPGFPRDMGASIEGSGKMLDIDGDGKDEFIVASTDGYVHAMKGDGTEASGWPVQLNQRAELTNENGNIADSCAFKTGADKDAAGCTTRGSVDPELNREFVMMGIGAGALTGNIEDGISVVALTYDGTAYVFDNAGQLAPGWPQRTNPSHSAVTHKNATLDEGFFGAPTLYDLDGDGDLEIIAAAMDQYLYVWHHDGSPMSGWPVLITDPLEEIRARMIITPAVGDADGDGLPEIAVCTNEVYGSNEARGYLLKHTGSQDEDDLFPALEEGWPITMTGLLVDTLPLIGRGCPTNPIMADLDGDGLLEIHLDAIAFYPLFWEPDGRPYRRMVDGEETVIQMNNHNLGFMSNSEDTPTYTLINHGVVAKLDPNDTLDVLKGTAGFDFALTFAEGGKRAIFDHHLSAWDTSTGDYLDYWPRVHDDWQFFVSPTVGDLDFDGHPEAITGSGGYLVHAWNYKGVEPAGFPKMTGGWVTTSTTFGDMTGNGKFDVVSATRNGWMFAWATEGSSSGRIEWKSFGHDAHNTNNYEEPVARYSSYDGSGVDGNDGTTGTDGTDGIDGTDSADATDAADGSDGTAATDATTSAGTTGGDTGDDGGCTAAGSGNPFGPLTLLALAMLTLLAIRRRTV